MATPTETDTKSWIFLGCLLIAAILFTQLRTLFG